MGWKAICRGTFGELKELIDADERSLSLVFPASGIACDASRRLDWIQDGSINGTPPTGTKPQASTKPISICASIKSDTACGEYECKRSTLLHGVPSNKYGDCAFYFRQHRRTWILDSSSPLPL